MQSFDRKIPKKSMPNYRCTHIAGAYQHKRLHSPEYLPKMCIRDRYIVKRKYAIEGLTTEELCEKLYEDMAGYSFLKKWIYKPGIEEMCIRDSEIPGWGPSSSAS